MGRIGVLILLFTALAATANDKFRGKSVHEDEQLWMAYFNQTRFHKAVGGWGEVHLRTKDNMGSALNLAFIRVGPQFYIKDNIRPGLLYAYIHFFEGGNLKTPVYEHRFAQQFWFAHNFRNFRINHILRNENRWIQKTKDGYAIEGFNFRNRLRFNFSVMAALTGKGFKTGVPIAVLNNELMINTYASDVLLPYDQNRFFAGLGLMLSESSFFHAGYLNVFQQRTNDYELVHGLRVFFYQNINLMKQDIKADKKRVKKVH